MRSLYDERICEVPSDSMDLSDLTFGEISGEGTMFSEDVDFSLFHNEDSTGFENFDFGSAMTGYEMTGTQAVDNQNQATSCPAANIQIDPFFTHEMAKYPNSRNVEADGRGVYSQPATIHEGNTQNANAMTANIEPPASEPKPVRRRVGRKKKNQELSEEDKALRREFYLERNRLAANKCRTKQNQKQEHLKNEEARLKAENIRLTIELEEALVEARMLREQAGRNCQHFDLIEQTLTPTDDISATLASALQDEISEEEIGLIRSSQLRHQGQVWIEGFANARRRMAIEGGQSRTSCSSEPMSRAGSRAISNSSSPNTSIQTDQGTPQACFLPNVLNSVSGNRQSPAFGNSAPTPGPFGHKSPDPSAVSAGSSEDIERVNDSIVVVNPSCGIDQTPRFPFPIFPNFPQRRQGIGGPMVVPQASG